MVIKVGLKNEDEHFQWPSLAELLTQWAGCDAERCHVAAGNQFAVLYQGRWLSVTAELEHHGAIIAAIMEACQSQGFHFKIDYTPRDESEPECVQVGCIPRVFRYREGETAITMIPVLLLQEYIDRFTGEISWLDKSKL